MGEDLLLGILDFASYARFRICDTFAVLSLLSFLMFNHAVSDDDDGDGARKSPDRFLY